MQDMWENVCSKSNKTKELSRGIQGNGSQSCSKVRSKASQQDFPKTVIVWIRAILNLKKDLNNEINNDNPVIELDEMWTFVGSRENEVWIWLQKLILARFQRGDRSSDTFKRLWDGISDKIKQNLYTDRWDVYNLIPYSQRIIKKPTTQNAYS